MKRVLAMFLLLALLLAGCTKEETEEQKLVKATFDNLYAAMVAGDVDGFLSQFAANQDRDALTDQAEALFDWLKGDFQNYTVTTGPIVYDTVDHGNAIQELRTLFIVNTSEEEYYFAVNLVASNGADQSAVGITSIYVITSQAHGAGYAYWGDGKWTPGIHIDLGSQS